ncbi:MAG: flippase-like domain-containing protein [Candidatus Omnitrophica bacterium]|nr:flippase-like domain-containing protein [Candidatus Omnitrophota bacterium]
MQKHKKKRLSFIVRTLFLCVLIYLLVRLVDFRELVDVFSGVSWGFAVLVLLTCILDLAVMGSKWNILLYAFGIRVPVRMPVIAYFTGRGFSFFLPSTIGIDSYKTYFMVKHKAGDIPSVLSSIIVERTIGMVSSFGIISLLLPFSIPVVFPGNNMNWWGAGLTCFLALCILVLLSLDLVKYSAIVKVRIPFIPESLKHKVKAFFTVLFQVHQAKRLVFIYFLASVAEKTLYGTAAFFSLRAIGHEFSYLAVLGVVPLISLLERLPISFSSVGVREGLYVAIFTSHGLTAAEALSTALIIRASEVVIVATSIMLWYMSGLSAATKNEVVSLAAEVDNVLERETS